MAERRMFSKSVVQSDSFMDLPAEAQMLYIHLNMASDDDGFCDRPRSVMRDCKASDDSMKLLIAKKFVLTFEKNDGFVVVIKHWRINNYIRKDNYRETRYKEFMRQLYYDENKSYSMNSEDGHTPCVPSRVSNEPVTNLSQPRIQPVDDSYTDRIQAVDDSLTQDRIGKDSIVKVSIGEDRIGKEGCGEENPEPAPKPAGNSSDLSEERKNRIRFWKGRVDFMKQNKYSTECMYSVALAEEGITKEDIDNFRED